MHTVTLRTSDKTTAALGKYGVVTPEDISTREYLIDSICIAFWATSKTSAKNLISNFGPDVLESDARESGAFTTESSTFCDLVNKGSSGIDRVRVRSDF